MQAHLEEAPLPACCVEQRVQGVWHAGATVSFTNWVRKGHCKGENRIARVRQNTVCAVFPSVQGGCVRARCAVQDEQAMDGQLKFFWVAELRCRQLFSTESK